MGRTMVPLEHHEQKMFVAWFRAKFSARIYAIPNGGGRSKAEAGRLKAEGVDSGVPDLHVPEWRLWIEMKRQKRSTTRPAQKDWHAYLRSIGDTVFVCKGFQAAMKAVLEWRAEA